MCEQIRRDRKFLFKNAKSYKDEVTIYTAKSKEEAIEQFLYDLGYIIMEEPETKPKKLKIEEE